ELHVEMHLLRPGDDHPAEIPARMVPSPAGADVKPGQVGCVRALPDPHRDAGEPVVREVHGLQQRLLVALVERGEETVEYLDPGGGCRLVRGSMGLVDHDGGRLGIVFVLAGFAAAGSPSCSCSTLRGTSSIAPRAKWPSWNGP